MAKVLVAITNETYVRNYLRTDALTELRQNHKVRVVTDESLGLADEVAENEDFLGFYNLQPAPERLHHFHFNLMMWRNRRRSRTFFYRWLRNSNWHLIRRDRGLLTRLLSYVHWFVAALLNPRGLRIPLLANRLVFPISSAIVRSRLQVNESLAKILSRERFDIILFPSAAFDSVSVDLVSLGRNLGITTVCLIDNWDNLSSKTVFWEKPDHIVVWGPQARTQAIEIHGFSPDQIHMIGTPRFDPYFVLRKKPPASSRKAPFGLYVGSAMPFDDIGTLHEIEEIIKTSPNIPDEFRLLYRPHPWQQKRTSSSTFNPSEFSRVELDPQFEKATAEGWVDGQNSPVFQPDLDYYPKLLLSSKFVIGPLTTMLLEASLCLRPVVALAYYDGVHANTTRRYFSHFEGMEMVPGFEFCERRSDLAGSLLRAIHAPRISRKASDAATSQFIIHDSASYGGRLDSLVKRILG